MPIFRGKEIVSSASDSKSSVRLATRSDILLTSSVTVIDGLELVNQDRVLLAGQDNQAQNGIYVWNAISGKLARSLDADSITEVSSGMRMFVEEGVANEETYWTLTTPGRVILGTSALTFIKDYRLGEVGTSISIKSATTTIDVSAAEAPTTGQVLTATSSTSANWQSPVNIIAIRSLMARISLGF